MGRFRVYEDKLNGPYILFPYPRFCRHYLNGSITRQMQRGSKSHEMLAQTARNFSQTESTMENTFNNLQEMQVLMAQMNQNQRSIEDSVERLPDVREQVRDMQR